MHKTQTDSVRTVLALLLGLVELAAVFLLSKQLAGHRDRDVVSFVLPYRPTAQTLKRAQGLTESGSSLPKRCSV